MPTVPGCTEHHLKLPSIMADAKKRHKALAICWLDLANAYCSVHHALIQFSLRYYHAPPQFLSVLQVLYKGLSAKVIITDWETPLVSLQKGVYQGDPLSVVIFNTVMNTLVDTVISRSDLGYQISDSVHRVNILQYAADTCLLANSPASCQFLLSSVADWLHWAGMTAKVPKCKCISLQGSTGRLTDPHLQLHGISIPFTKDSIKFLGLEVQVPNYDNTFKESLQTNLLRMLEAVDSTSVSRRQKLLLYKAGVCPRLTWPLLVHEYPITWVERHIDALTTRYLKRWAGLAKSANTGLLNLPRSMGGLSLPLPSILHKKLQVSRQSQLLTSCDSCVRHLAERGLKHELTLTRKKFRPATIVRDTLIANPDHNCKSLSKAAKATVTDEANKNLLDNLQSLVKQGHMSRSTDSKCASVWSETVQSLSDEQMRFSLNAAVDTLPHNANLYLWKKRDNPSCPLCSQYQSLLYVLNNCPVARDLRRYNHRHDSVSQLVAEALAPTLSPSTTLTVDIGNNYNFPLHIAPTNLRPDLVWWDDSVRSARVAELTVCFESNFSEAAQRKAAKYTDLMEQAEQNGYSTTLLTLQMGSRGIPHYPSFKASHHHWNAFKRALPLVAQSH